MKLDPSLAKKRIKVRQAPEGFSKRSAKSGNKPEWDDFLT